MLSGETGQVSDFMNNSGSRVLWAMLGHLNWKLVRRVGWLYLWKAPPFFDRKVTIT